ncbi:MAG TPA: D-alanine--D-alanine ligase family protein [Actinomycetota bacterium]|nr:D-alanine--D-alanine ligase family protein [Actinomycetota bacterium]
MSGLRVLVLFGGRSGEHEVSVVSARTVVAALESLGHVPCPVGISRAGRWVACDPRSADSVPDQPDDFELRPDPAAPRDYDVVFPVLHGPYGEDGCVQGLLELADVPYVGSGVLGSAVAIDKITHKRLLAAAGLPVVGFVEVRRQGWDSDPQQIREAVAAIGYPCFAKPSRLGSSVGISKVQGPGELDEAIARALLHDDRVLVEAHGGPREVEVAVLETEPLSVSVTGEVTPDGEWYDYRAKYRGEWTVLNIPADLPDDASETARDYAARAFRVTACEGLARVDFFWDPVTEEIVVNEINSMPGITPKSMFPRLMEASGVPFAQVVSHLLDHALRRHEAKLRLERARSAAHAEEVGEMAAGTGG